MGKHKSSDYKLTAVQHYLNTEGESLIDTCDIFQCSKYSLVRWLRRYITTGNVDNLPRAMLIIYLELKVYIKLEENM